MAYIIVTLLHFLQDHGTVTSQIVTGMDHGGMVIVMMEEETATGIAMMTGTAETSTEVSSCAC